MSAIFIFVAFIILFILAGIRVLNEYERGVVFRLGRIIEPKGPGLRWIIPGVDKMFKIGLRVITLEVPSQDVITRDNDSVKAIIQVENYLYATSQLAQTTLRSVLGQVELDDLLSEREKLNIRLQEVLDKHTDPWGMKVSLVEVKFVDLPQEMQRAMAKQAEAERERRAKVINAEGEYQAATRLAEASDILSRNPMSLQLRYLQTLIEVSSEKNSTIVFPIPIDLLRPFFDKSSK